MAIEGQVAGPHHVTELLAGAQLVEEGGGHDVVGQGEAGEIPRPGGAGLVIDQERRVFVFTPLLANEVPCPEWR